MRAKEQYLRAIELAENNLNKFLYSSDERYQKNLIETKGKTPAEAKSLASWDWTHGVGIYGIFKYYQLTGDEKHLNYIIDWLQDRIRIGLPEKNVNTVGPLLTMAFVFEIRPLKQFEVIMREWAEWILTDMKRTEEGGIQHCHAELENNQELWDDTLFMTVLFLAKAGRLFNRQDYIEEAVYQFLIHSKYLIDSKTSLWFHGWTFLDRNNFAGALWGRGNCWISIFIPEFLEIVDLPPAIRHYILNVFEGQMKALKKYQSSSGLWHTLIDDDTSYLEASGTAGFCYGMLKGIRKGYLDESYLEYGKRALEAILGNINEDGEMLQVSYGTNVGRTLEHYKQIPLTRMHYGQSLAMLALIEGLKCGIYAGGNADGRKE